MILGLGISGLPDGPYMWVAYLLARTIISLPVAYFAKRKGYNYWSFLIAGALFNPLAPLVILLAVPRIARYVGKGEAVALTAK